MSLSWLPSPTPVSRESRIIKSEKLDRCHAHARYPTSHEKPGIWTAIATATSRAKTHPLLIRKIYPYYINSQPNQVAATYTVRGHKLSFCHAERSGLQLTHLVRFCALSRPASLTLRYRSVQNDKFWPCEVDPIRHVLECISFNRQPVIHLSAPIACFLSVFSPKNLSKKGLP